MHSFLYVSVRRPITELDAHEIVSAARSRNALLELTGALIATPTHYAQILEGPERSLGQILGSIRRDPRHSDMRTVHLPIKPRREFLRWSLAYSGDSSYVSGLVRGAITARDFELDEQVDALRALMLMLA